MQTYPDKVKIGVFDSGIGGEALALGLRKSFPNTRITTVNDKAHVPYGSRSKAEIISLTDKAIQPLLEGNDVIVIACNTATAYAIDTLRSKYSDKKIIGIEPMIKSASKLTETGIIGVCATPATLQSERYKKLIQKYADHLEIIEPDCSNWAYMIENNVVNEQQIASTIDNMCAKNADVIVLGCTHYHWIKDLIEKLAKDRVTVLEPSEAIARRVASLLSKS